MENQSSEQTMVATVVQLEKYYGDGEQRVTAISVLQRTRELGLLRALGFTGAQVRRMVLAESTMLATAALGLALIAAAAPARRAIRISPVAALATD